MRILIVGSSEIYAIENYYKKNIELLGAEVLIFTAQNYFYEYYQKSFLNKILYRTSLSKIVLKINRLFIKTIEEFKPDVIWIFKGMEITPASLVWARRNNIKIANYNPDNPFIFSGRGSGNSNVRKSIHLYDLHFTYNLEVKMELEKKFKIPVIYLPFGFELSEAVFKECANQFEIRKVCFLGNPDEERANFLKKIAESGVDIDLYGNNWSNFINSPNITSHQPVYGKEFWMLLRRYRIQINLMRVHNLNSHNMRSFEVPAVGGIMVAPDTPEHREFFEDGKEIFLFDSANHCVELIKAILNLSEDEANGIRINARARSLNSGYGYKDRAVIAFQALKQIIE